VDLWDLLEDIWIKYRHIIKPAIYVAVGLLIAFPVFSMTYFTMVRTSTPGFCSICHEIKPAYQAWLSSTHVNNAQGLVADCMDCHLPAPHDTLDFFFSKTFHGAKDVVLHFAVKEYDRDHARRQAWASIKNDQCLKCHRNLLYIPDRRGAMLAHRDVIYARAGYEKRCLDCHRNLVHNDSPVYRYKQYQQPYQGRGL